MKTLSKTVVLAILVGLVAATAASAYAADTEWEKNHPRRDQVNDRLAHQNERIKEQVKQGDMSEAEATALHKEHRRIREEERLMASQTGGHITILEQKALNQQVNAVGKQIGH
jgi:uncharacterized membrane protein YebE (DUF533 family)